jgi:hypothetical protein
MATEKKALAICPGCGLLGSPELFLGEAAKRAAVKTALAMPSPLAEQVLAYIGLFRPRQRGHSWDRVERLLSELLPLVQSPTVEHEGRALPCTLAHWQAALDELLVNRRPTLELPLTSHRYLLAMVAGEAARAARPQRPPELPGAERTRGGPPPATTPEQQDQRQLIQQLFSRLATLKRLAAANPGAHDEELARVQSQLASARANTGAS